MPANRPAQEDSVPYRVVNLSFLKELGYVKGDPNILRDSILYLANRCGYVYPVKIAKLLYLAEIEHIDRVGKRLTSAEFISDNYGPNPREATLVIDLLEMEGWLKSSVETTKRGYMMTKIRPSRPLPKLGLSGEAIRTLEIVVHRWKFRNTDRIVAASKETAPFKAAPSQSPIDLDDYLTERNLLASPRIQHQVAESEEDLKQGRFRKFTAKGHALEYLDSL